MRAMSKYTACIVSMFSKKQHVVLIDKIEIAKLKLVRRPSTLLKLRPRCQMSHVRYSLSAQQESFRAYRRLHVVTYGRLAQRRREKYQTMKRLFSELSIPSTCNHRNKRFACRSPRTGASECEIWLCSCGSGSCGKFPRPL